MTVPLVDLKAQYLSMKGEIDTAISRVLSRACFIQGEEVALFEREFADFCGASEAIGVASGSDALRLALAACAIGPGDEVITTPLTFVATVEAICHVGATPVLVDIDPETLNIDPEGIESAITSRTRAVVPVHLYGFPVEMERICQIACKSGLKVIEDASHAHGATYKNKRVGSIGHLGCFSFYPSNILGAFGDAGMVVTSDSAMASQIRLLQNHGRGQGWEEHLRVGFNSRMDTLQAAVLRVKLLRLNKWNDRRRAIASRYRKLLKNQSIKLPPEHACGEPVYYHFVVRTPQRGHWRRALKSIGIDTGIHFPIPVHLQAAYRHLGYQIGDFPASERAAQEVISLPIYPELTDMQVQQVAGCFSQAAMQPLEFQAWPAV